MGAKQNIMRRGIAIMLAVAVMPATVSAQSDPEYRAELGGGIGLVAYEGDFNGSPLRNMQPMLSLLGRYKMNPRMAVAMNISYGWLKGSSENTATYYPNLPVTEFKHGVADIGVRYEYNFWPYGTGREYRGAQRLTPYISLGLGATVAKPGKTLVAVNMPLGVGVKYKIGQRTNFAAEWAVHFTGSDRLDGVADPYGIKSSGLFKNTDGYSHLRLSLTYDFWAKCKTCHNDRY